MPLIKWKEQYAVGIRQIDRQHQYLLHLVNQTYEKQNPKNILYELIVYASYHFFCEEQLMEDIGYPGLLQHRGDHNGFSQRLQEIAMSQGKAEDVSSLEFLLVVDQWLTCHVMESDMEFGRFVSSMQK